MSAPAQKDMRMLTAVAVFLAVVFVSIVAVNITHSLKSNEIKETSADQLLYISRFSANLATSHLWLEEAIISNNKATLQLYTTSSERAIAAYWHIPNQHQGSLALEKYMNTLMAYLQRYDELATIRIKDARHAGINTLLDETFDANFKRMMAVAEEMSETIYVRIKKNQQERELIQKVTLISGLLILFVLVLLLHQFMRRYQRLKTIEKDNIKALRESARELRESEYHLQQAQSIAHIGSWEINGKTGALLWSDEVYKIFGLPKDVQPSYDFLLNAIHPEDRERMDQAWRVHTKERAEYNIVHRIIRPDHSLAYVHERSESTYDDQGQVLHSLGTVQDVTHLMLAKQEARLLQGVFHASSDMIGITNTDFTLLYANPTLRQCLGIDDKQNLEDISLDRCYAPDTWLKLQEKIMPDVLSNGVWQGELRLQHHGHGSIDVSQIVQAHVDDTERVSHISFTARDISKEKQQQKKQEHNQRLESLGVLAGGIAHDFNNLLTAIMGHASMACELIEEDERAEHLAAIVKSSQSAADLCRQMLVYSGKGKFIIEPLHVSTLVEDMGHLLSVSIDKKIIVHCDLAKPSPVIRGDRTQIQQLIMNLIINASEAIGNNNGTIHLRTGVWHIDGSSLPSIYLSEPLLAGNYAYIEVSDTGCGMSKNVQSHLFEPFFTTKFTGRGLGMSAILGIIRGHHGSIQLSSTVGEGSTFKIFLPAIDEAPTVSTVVDATTSLTELQQQGCILIVDDEPMIRQLASMIIKKMGFDTIEAVDGLDAVEIFTEQHPKVIAILLDMTMPRMGGEEAFAALREINPSIPIILSSGYDEHTATSRLVDRSLTGFIQKPYAIKQLQKIITKIVASAPSNT